MSAVQYTTAMSGSNSRPLAIFTGYTILAAALTTKSVSIIRSQRRRGASSPPKDGSSGSGSAHRRAAASVFGILAALSLATTWCHMFRFFQWSYAQWAVAHVFGLGGVGATGDSVAGLRRGGG